MTYFLHPIRVKKSGFGPELGSRATECARAPIVIRPWNSMLGQLSLICWATWTTSPGCTPPLFSSPDVFTLKTMIITFHLCIFFVIGIMFPLIALLFLTRSGLQVPILFHHHPAFQKKSMWLSSLSVIINWASTGISSVAPTRSPEGYGRD